MTKTFKTSSTYRAARKQQKTASKKTFFDADGMMNHCLRMGYSSSIWGGRP